MPYLHLIDEAIGLLNTEIRLIGMAYQVPGQLQQRTNKQILSPLYLADKTTLINIMELVSGLFLSKNIVYQNGKPACLVDLAKAFEWLFNIKISDCHQKHEDVIKRKPGKITEFLNGLADLIRKEHDKKGYLRFIPSSCFWWQSFILILTSHSKAFAKSTKQAGLPFWNFLMDWQTLSARNTTKKDIDNQ